MSSFAILRSAPTSLKQIAPTCSTMPARAARRAAETEVSEGFGQSVTVRKGEVETIEYNRDKGSASRSTSASGAATPALRISAAGHARHGGCCAFHRALHRRGRCAGLADADTARARFPRSRPVSSLGPAGRAGDRAGARMRGRGALRSIRASPTPKARAVSAQQSQFVYGNTLGFLAGYPSSRHCIIVRGDRGQGRRHAARRLVHLGARSPPICRTPRSVVGAARRSARVRGSARARSRPPQVPVLFEAPIAAACSAISSRRSAAAACIARSSFLLDSLGKQVFSRLVHDPSNEPHVARGSASTSVRRRGRGDAHARSGEGRRGAGLFPRQLFGAQARAADPPATPAAITT